MRTDAGVYEISCRKASISAAYVMNGMVDEKYQPLQIFFDFSDHFLVLRV